MSTISVCVIFSSDFRETLFLWMFDLSNNVTSKEVVLENRKETCQDLKNILCKVSERKKHTDSHTTRSGFVSIDEPEVTTLCLSHVVKRKKKNKKN